MHYEPDDDPTPVEFISDAERIHQLRCEVAVLKSKLKALERQIEQLDVGRMREEIAVLGARVDALVQHRDSTAKHLASLFFVVMCVLFVSATNLAVTLTSAAGR